MNNRKMWAAPYIVWAAGFIILPLCMVIFYGMTSEDGSFTLSNLAAITDPIHYRAFIKSILIALAR